MGENIWGLLDPTAGILFSDKALGAVWVNSLLHYEQKLQLQLIVYYKNQLKLVFIEKKLFL